jgi:hypothetical protein
MTFTVGPIGVAAHPASSATAAAEQVTFFAAFHRGNIDISKAKKNVPRR